MAKSAKSNSEKYGPTLKAGKAEEFTMETFGKSRAEKEAGRKGFPVCAWGEAGIGKTELPNALIKKYADFFGGDSENGIPGNIVYVPMAQIEEKAELQGLPELQKTRRPLRYNYFTIKKSTKKDLEDKTKRHLTATVDNKEVSYTQISNVPLKKTDLKDFKALENISIGEYRVAEAKINDKKSIVMMIPEALDGSQMIVSERETPDGPIVDYVVDNRTIYATPSWIPQVDTHGEKGLLVIDDMNRADGRIINSIMQLLQDGALLGWALPIGWEIYCTCNPDNGKYEVTPFDGAQMTRMLNFVQKFDKDTWLVDWAIPTGIHPVAQNYVMTHPDMIVKGERTNPRSFDKFFRLIPELLDITKAASEQNVNITGKSEAAKAARKINDYGKMNIETESLQSFINFVTSGYGKLPDVEDILKNPKFKLKEFYDKIKAANGGKIRVDILAVLNTRICVNVEENKAEYASDKNVMKALRDWVKAEELPADLRWSAATNLSDCLADNFVDDEICQIIFNRVVK